MERKLRLAKDGQRENPSSETPEEVTYFYYLTTNPNEIQGPISADKLPELNGTRTYLRRSNESAFIQAYKHEDFIAAMHPPADAPLRKPVLRHRDPRKSTEETHEAVDVKKLQEETSNKMRPGPIKRFFSFLMPKVLWLLFVALVAGGFIYGNDYLLQELTGEGLHLEGSLHLSYLVLCAANAFLVGIVIHFIVHRMLFTGVLTAMLAGLFVWGHFQCLEVMNELEENYPWSHANVSYSFISYELHMQEGTDLEKALEDDTDPRTVRAMLNRIDSARLNKYFAAYLTESELAKQTPSNVSHYIDLTSERMADRNEAFSKTFRAAQEDLKHPAHYSPGVIVAQAYGWLRGYL